MLTTVRFVPVPANLGVDETTPAIAILHITKAVTAHGRRGSVAAAPRSDARPSAGRAASVAHGAASRGSVHVHTDAEAAAPPPARAVSAGARTPRTAAGSPADGGGSVPAAGEPAASSAADEPSPEASPGLTAEMIAKVNQQMREALPSAMPQTMKHYATDPTALAIATDPNRLTAANYPLPHSGLFAHARVARTANEAIAVRAIQRIGNAYICIGYLAKIDAYRPGDALAGPYIGPCKRAWREQLGLNGTATPLPSPQSTAPAPEPTSTTGRSLNAPSGAPG